MAKSSSVNDKSLKLLGSTFLDCACEALKITEITALYWMAWKQSAGKNGGTVGYRQLFSKPPLPETKAVLHVLSDKQNTEPLSLASISNRSCMQKWHFHAQSEQSTLPPRPITDLCCCPPNGRDCNSQVAKHQQAAVYCWLGRKASLGSCRPKGVLLFDVPCKTKFIHSLTMCKSAFSHANFS